MILGFKSRFVSSVADGTKPHTIRAGARWRVGMSIQFYQNVRQPGMTKIRENGVAMVVQEVCLKHVAWKLPNGWKTQTVLFVDGRQLTPLECEELARRDGFDDFRQLWDWFDNTHGLPFTGQLVCWTDLRY